MKIHHPALFFLLTFTCLAEPGDPIVLLQPDQTIGERLKGDATDLAHFITSSMEVFENVVPIADTRRQACFVVAFGPAYYSKGWILGDHITERQKEEFNTKLRELKPPELKAGVVAFEVIGKNSEAAKNVSENGIAPPTPPEWREAVQKEGGTPMDIDKVLENLLIKRKGGANHE